MHGVQLDADRVRHPVQRREVEAGQLVPGRRKALEEHLAPGPADAAGQEGGVIRHQQRTQPEMLGQHRVGPQQFGQSALPQQGCKAGAAAQPDDGREGA